MNESIRIENISFSYSAERKILENITLNIRLGEFILLSGRNGAGKSTLLKLLVGILKPNEGTIEINGINTYTSSTSKLAGRIAVTFQNPSDQIFASSVKKEIEFAPLNLKRQNKEELVSDAIKLLELNKKVGRHPYELSYADRKLISIASAVASGCQTLAFDEPSAGLSEPEYIILTRALHSLKESGKTLIIVSHDLEFFLPICTRMIILDRGMIAYDSPPKDVFSNEVVLRRKGLRLPLTYRLLSLSNINCFINSISETNTSEKSASPNL